MTSLTALLLAANGAAALFAIAFVVFYLRTIVKAEEVGPTPMSWILFAVGSALIAASAVVEAVRTVVGQPFVVHLEKVYFMLGNVILFAVLFRTWREVIKNG
jgi:hypothetical protein